MVMKRTGFSGDVLLRAVRSATVTAELTDRDLLIRFRDGDESAFATLVNRHSGMVLGVCRRVLPTIQDAEDACQATFLVLARKAASGPWQPSIANWLYTTARRIASKANRAASRRAKRESQTVQRATASAIDQMSGREAFAVLDEELDCLPAIYREPLVLCYLEGLTRDEAATRLRVPPATLKSQLERGRKRLGNALTRRGISLGAGLLALATTSRVGASPPRLIEAIQASVAGDVPPTVAALARGVAVHGIIKKSLFGLVGLTAVAVVGFGLGEPRNTSAGPAPEKAPQKTEKKEELGQARAKNDAESTRTITGKVIDPDGKPVAGAEMIHFVIEGSATVIAKTDADGAFKVTVALKDGRGAYLFPRVAGFASADYLMPATNTPAEKTFTLIKDTPIKGRVIDTQGKPVVGATVAVRNLSGYENDSLDTFLATFQKREADSHYPGSKWFVSIGAKLDPKQPGGEQVFAASTDKDGRFTIANVGSERKVDLYVHGPGIADAEVVVLTRKGFDPEPYNKATIDKLKVPYSELGYHPMLNSPDPAIVAEAEKPIRGVVKETESGKPMSGVFVSLHSRISLRLPNLTATTDADGKYEIRGAKKGNDYELSVKRELKTGMLGRTVKVQDTPAYEPVIADIPVARGIILTGRVLDDGSGKPVPGFACVGVLFDNEFAKRPEYASPDCYDYANTDKEGVYRTVVPPGPILLMGGPTPDGRDGEKVYLIYQQLRTDPEYPQYFAKELSGFRSPGGTTTMIQGVYCKVLKLKPEQREVTADIVLKRSSTFTLKVQDPDGKPARDIHAAGTTSRDWMHATKCEGDSCTIYDLEKAKPRVVALCDAKHNLAATVTLKGDEKEPVIVKLAPVGKVKGVLVNEAGKPIANAIVHLQYANRAADEIDRVIRGDRRTASPTRVETNADGEFNLDGVIPGEAYSVYARKNDRFLTGARKPDGMLETNFKLKPGETVDLGRIALKVD
jgi:RNA polymerase sigma factor (sigma-70 family)